MKIVLIFAAIFGAASAFVDVTVFEWLTVNDGYTNFTHMLMRSGLHTKLQGFEISPLTVFAPNDFAFRKLGGFVLTGLLQHPAQLEKVMQYHMVNESLLIAVIPYGVSTKMTIEGQKITIDKFNDTKVNINNRSDIQSPLNVVCRNGVIQPINSVLIPPETPHFTVAHILLMEDKDFADMAIYLMITGLLESVQNMTDVTLFAPTDGAFLRDFRLTSQTSQTDAEKVLNFHMVPGRRTKASLKNGEILYTVEGSPLNVVVTPGAVMVNHAVLTGHDFEASNGYIYSINHVLFPPSVARPT